MVNFVWIKEGEEIPSDMVDPLGNLVVTNITEGEYADRDGVEYYCVATRFIGKNSYSASVRSRMIKVFYACELFLDYILRIVILDILLQFSMDLNRLKHVMNSFPLL